MLRRSVHSLRLIETGLQENAGRTGDSDGSERRSLESAPVIDPQILPFSQPHFHKSGRSLGQALLQLFETIAGDVFGGGNMRFKERDIPIEKAMVHRLDDFSQESVHVFEVDDHSCLRVDLAFQIGFQYEVMAVSVLGVLAAVNLPVLGFRPLRIEITVPAAEGDFATEDDGAITEFRHLLPRSLWHSRRRRSAGSVYASEQPVEKALVGRAPGLPPRAGRRRSLVNKAWIDQNQSARSSRRND